MNARHVVGLVGCASSKLQHQAPARELYTSPLFRKASAYAEQTCDRWYILSAKHGLIHPDTVIDPYDMKLGANYLGGQPIQQWADHVREQLAVELADVPAVTLVALAGERYRSVLHPCQWPYQIPMKGMGIGQQLGYLTCRLGAAA